MIELPDIEVQNVSVFYQKGKKAFQAVKDVSFNVARGEIISIVGPSGCGKSSLLRLLAGIDKPKSGSIRINPDREKIGIGYTPQSPQLLPWRTLFQNAFIGTEISNKKYTKASISRVSRLIDNFRLTGSEDCYPSELSGGMSQRVSLIRALQNNPAILFCDEPFSAVDFVGRFNFNERFRTECDAGGITCVVVTHNIEEAIYLSNQVYLMGGTPGTILKQYSTRHLPDIHDPVLCRETAEFISLFKEIWNDLQHATA